MSTFYKSNKFTSMGHPNPWIPRSFVTTSTLHISFHLFHWRNNSFDLISVTIVLFLCSVALFTDFVYVSSRKGIYSGMDNKTLHIHNNLTPQFIQQLIYLSSHPFIFFSSFHFAYFNNPTVQTDLFFWQNTRLPCGRSAFDSQPMHVIFFFWIWKCQSDVGICYEIKTVLRS